VTVGRLWARCGHGMGLGPESAVRRTVTPYACALAITIRLARCAAAGDLVLDGHVAMIVGNGMVIETGCQLGVQNGRRHGIAWAHFMCPSKPSDFAMSR
jgi:hypothetical protein